MCHQPWDWKYLTEREVAEFLGWPLLGVEMLIREGVVPTVEWGDYRMVRRAEFEEFARALEWQAQVPSKRRAPVR